MPVTNAPTSEIATLLKDLSATERGFLLGLLLSRGQAEHREDIANSLAGDPGVRCAEAVRRANALPREGRLELIHFLGNEILGARSAWPAHAEGIAALATILANESPLLLRFVAEQPISAVAGGAQDPSVDALAEAARIALRESGAANSDPSPLPPPSESGMELLFEIRRALLAPTQFATGKTIPNP